MSIELSEDRLNEESGGTTDTARRDSPANPAFCYVRPIYRWYLPLKSLIDWIAAVLLLIPAVPFIVVAGLLVKLTSHGPIFYCQTRLGKHGRPFTLIKLRTMIDGAEAYTGPVWATSDDPRVTPLGWFLRESHIDEFPQLFNVLFGHMSLVGPRPERPEMVCLLECELAGYRNRLVVRPGITGVAQLRLPADADTDSVRKKMAFDLYYVRNANLWLDARVIFFTGVDWIKSIIGYSRLRRLFAAVRRRLEVPRWSAVASFAPPRNAVGNGGAAQSALLVSPVHSYIYQYEEPLRRVGADGNGRRSPLNVFSVDVEDYFHVNAFSRHVDRRTWPDYESRVVRNTHRVLEILEQYQVRGTFFVLGWVAAEHPQLVRAIQRSGHEIGCHSFWHRSVFDLTPEEFREDLLQGAKAIEEITGERVTAFRAPNFSITERSLWALDILIEEGFRYDSSIFPIYHDTYGIPQARRYPYTIERSQDVLAEFPPSVYRLWKLNIPVGGGGYFRLYPSRLSTYWLRRINQRDERPFMFYVHPWELDPDQPRLPAPWRSRFRHYKNLDKTEQKLHQLLGRFRFGRLSEAIDEELVDSPRLELSGEVHRVDSAPA